MKLVGVMVTSMMVSACSLGAEHTMNYSDLNRFVVDCTQQTQQRKFLSHQLAKTSPYDYPQRAVIFQAMRELDTRCLSPSNQRSDCVTVQEDFGPIPATSMVCRLPGRPDPVINIWQTEID